MARRATSTSGEPTTGLHLADVEQLLVVHFRLVVPEAPGLPSPVAALLGSATPLRLLTERLARARGTNPDPIRRDDPVYVAASDAAEG
jgi:hypothetical protein